MAGIELGHSSCRITIADLGAQPIAQTTVPVAFTDDYESILASITAALRALLSGMDDEHGELASVTLGLPMSATLDAVGLLQTKGLKGWMGYPVHEWLETELAVTVHLENDVNLMALGERMESFPGTNDLLLVHVADGVGTATIADGRLVRGAKGLAGEIAHVPTPRHHSKECLCGNVGCLAAVATLPAILHTLRDEGVDASSLDDVMQLVTRGDATAARVLRDAGRHVGEVLVYSISSTNPEVLVLSGSLAFAGDYLVAGIREALYRTGSAALTDSLRVVRSSNPLGAGTRGALQLSAEHVLTDGSLFALLDDAAS
ncbi:MAG: ROK family protein [Leifsonia sp.]